MHVHCQFRSVPIREQEKQLLANQVYDIQCNMVRGAVPVNMMNVTRGNMTTVSRGNGAAGAKDDEWDFVGSEEWPTPPIRTSRTSFADSQTRGTRRRH